MNERIKELAEQAEQYALDRANEGSDEDYDYAFDDDFREKFAELIVRECIAQCEKNKDHEWLGSGSKLSAFNIREHFGVKE